MVTFVTVPYGDVCHIPLWCHRYGTLYYIDPLLFMDSYIFNWTLANIGSKTITAASPGCPKTKASQCSFNCEHFQWKYFKRAVQKLSFRSLILNSEVYSLPIAGGNASATCLKMLVMRFADVQWPAPLSLLQHFAAQYKSFAIIIIIHYYYFKQGANQERAWLVVVDTFDV